MALPRFIDIHPSGQTSFNPLPKGFPLWGNGKGAVLQKKAAYRVPISRFFVQF